MKKKKNLRWHLVFLLTLDTINNYLDRMTLPVAIIVINQSFEVTDSQYFVANFQIRWWANDVWRYKTACVDLVTIKKSTSSGLYSLDISGQFSINLSTYPLEDIQTVEIQTR